MVNKANIAGRLVIVQSASREKNGIHANIGVMQDRGIPLYGSLDMTKDGVSFDQSSECYRKGRSIIDSWESFIIDNRKNIETLINGTL